ncbi:caspase domain-containing protein [Streptomyces sp. NPDC017936]|uniref:caspase domain-containing protein n=1 Tax=Streptomyces sp. NPDC017936 TaxID=3365016 RepID=UPI0037AC692B
MTDSRHALIIANDRYEDRGLKKLRAPVQDASALAEVLHDPKIGDFEVEVVRNEPVSVISRRIQGFFHDRRRADTLVLHFSCHGLKSESGELYFAATDTDPRLLDATAIPAQFVHRCMRRTRAGSTVLFLDCCYGGAFSRGSSSVRATGDVNALESFTGDKPPGGRGWAVITASNSMEYAFEGPELADRSAPQPSVFTHAVVQGLQTGEADLDADGEVSLDDLYDYVFDHVREQNPNQTPSRTVEMQGDLYLAHSRRGRINIPVVPSPPSLLAAMRSENAFTRQGAVVELRARLHDGDLGIAEGARQGLEEIARNDIRQIADQACRALREIRPVPSPDHLDFGLVPQGATPQQQSVTLGGPPLARHCVAQSTRSWLRVEPCEDGVHVRVETPAEGHLSGDILLKGVADDAVVHVEAVVAPAREPDQETEQPPPDRAPGTPGTSQAPRNQERPREVSGPPAAPEPPSRPPPSAGPDTVVVHPGPPSAPPREPPGITQEPPGTGTAPRRTPTEPAAARPAPAEPARSRPEPAGRAGSRRTPAGGTPAGGTPLEGTPLEGTPVVGTPTEGIPAEGTPTGPAPGGPGPSRSRRAPVLAGAALALAVTALVTVVIAVQRAVDAVAGRRAAGTGGRLPYYVQEAGLFPPLIVSLVTAGVALTLGAVARHELTARRHRCPPAAASATETMTTVTKGLAVPALVLGVLTVVAYLVAREVW